MGSRQSSSAENVIREVEDEEPRPLGMMTNVSNAGQNHPMPPRQRNAHRYHFRQRAQSAPIHPQGSQPQDKEKLKISIEESNTFHTFQCLHPEEHEQHERERFTFPSHQDCLRRHQDIDTPRRRRLRRPRTRTHSLTSHMHGEERLSTPVQDLQTHYSIQPADDHRVPHAGGRIPFWQVPVYLGSEQWIHAHHSASMVIRDDVAVGIPIQETQTSYSNPAAGHGSDSDDGD